MQHRLTDAEHPDRHYGDAEVTAVWVSQAGGRSIPLPDGVVAALGPEPDRERP